MNQAAKKSPGRNDHGSRGKLAAASDGSIGWLPVGGVKPARPSPLLGSEITRAVPQNPPASTDPALFYLNSGDVLPGNLPDNRVNALSSSSAFAARDANGFAPGASGATSALSSVRGTARPGWAAAR